MSDTESEPDTAQQSLKKVRGMSFNYNKVKDLGNAKQYKTEEWNHELCVPKSIACVMAMAYVLDFDKINGSLRTPHVPDPKDTIDACAFLTGNNNTLKFNESDHFHLSSPNVIQFWLTTLPQKGSGLLDSYRATLRGNQQNMVNLFKNDILAGLPDNPQITLKKGDAYDGWPHYSTGHRVDMRLSKLAGAWVKMWRSNQPQP